MTQCWRKAFIPVLSWTPAHRRGATVARRTSWLLNRSSFLHRSSLSSCRKRLSTMPPSEATTVASAASPEVAVAPEAPVEKFLKDYKPPTFLVDNVRLAFHLDDDGLNTEVKSVLVVRPDCPAGTPFILDGEHLDLVPGSLMIDGVPVPEAQFEIDSKKGILTIKPSAIPVTETFTVESTVRIKPAKNTALEGLYMSSGNYCTQCEAEGFRRITYFPDRPDVMSKYTVRITGTKSRFPVLLSNGNIVGSGDVEGDPSKHWAEYEDPFKKPCYLFALVAGDLVHVEDSFKTMNGRDVTLRIYVKGESELPKCVHAMRSLKKSMKWDEDVYGLEYDLDIFNIVAVPDFTMGAMENKSLNIFNSKYVLVSQATATDTDFNNVEGVVAHEYFHNYSGNRVTVNSWFQLSLKEGLTVFRDQSFSADMNAATVKRISDVNIMRTAQFAEDSGPMAHPIRPASYITCNNFYTVTVYDKGAEVIRMLHTLVGPKGFRAGTDIYFSRHDSQAVTTDHWIQAIADGNPGAFDVEKFKRWYSQAGTPEVTVTSVYDKEKKTLTLNMKQVVPPTHKQKEKLPALIPVKTGLIGPDGKSVLMDLGGSEEKSFDKVLILSEDSQSFVLHNVPEGTMPSLLRNFSAPVKLKYEQGESLEALAFQMGNDADEFNRWEAGQKSALKIILQCINSTSDDFPAVPESITTAFRKTLVNEDIDAALRAEVFYLPSESYIVDQMEIADPVKIRAARKHVRKEIASALEKELRITLNNVPETKEYTLDPAAQGGRALRNVAMSYLAMLENDEFYDHALTQVRSGSNMTDVLAALGTLASSECEQRDIALQEFYNKWENERLVVDKWMRIQASAPRPDALESVTKLMDHKAFDIAVPNCVYALIGGYAGSNLHMSPNGEGYKFLTDQILRLDKLNPHVAARLARVFTRMKKYDADRQALMVAELERIKATEGLSKDVFEVVTNCLAVA